MGYRRKRSRRRHHDEQHQRLDQYGERDRSGSAEQRSLSVVESVDRSGAGTSPVSGADEDSGGEVINGHGVSLDHDEIRVLDDGSLRVSGETEGKVDAPALRLVGSEQKGISAEPISSGLASAAVDSIREQEGSAGTGEEATNGSAVVADAAPASLVRRSFDAAEINAILNDPYVFKHVAIAGQEKLDVSQLIENPNVYLLMAEGGSMIFTPLEPCVYEIHTAFLKSALRSAHENGHTGPYIQNACLAAYRWMFTQTDCVVILTKIPHHNRAALVFAPTLGWQIEYTRKNAFATHAGDLVDVTYCALRYDDWLRKTPALEIAGREFHKRLADEFARFGYVEPQHPDEDCHDRRVGACIEMMLGGQPEKAVILYNSWARFADYGEINLVSRNPLLINIGNALLQVSENNFKMIKPMVRH